MSDLVERLQQVASSEEHRRRADEDAAVAWVRKALRADYERAKERLVVLENESLAILSELAKYREQGSGFPVGLATIFEDLAGQIHVLLMGGAVGPFMHALSAAATTRMGLQAFKDLRYEEIADANRRRAFILTT